MSYKHGSPRAAADLAEWEYNSSWPVDSCSRLVNHCSPQPEVVLHVTTLLLTVPTSINSHRLSNPYLDASINITVKYSHVMTGTMPRFMSTDSPAETDLLGDVRPKSCDTIVRFNLEGMIRLMQTLQNRRQSTHVTCISAWSFDYRSSAKFIYFQDCRFAASRVVRSNVLLSCLCGILFVLCLCKVI